MKKKGRTRLYSSFILRPSSLPCRVPLAFELGDLAAAVDLAGELPVAQDLAFGDGVVDDVVDGQAGEGEDAVEAGLDDAAFAGGLMDRRRGGETGGERFEESHGGMIIAGGSLS